MGLLRDLFIPHQGNDYAPHALQKIAAGALVLMVLVTFAIANLQSMLWVTSDWMVSTILPAVVVEETNQERASGALGTLKRNPVLDRAATLKAEHMAAEGYFAHYSPEGVSPWHWFNVTDYNFAHAGENLAVHFTDSSQVVSAWMESPTHRANIMNGQYEEIGIGVAEGTFEGFETIFVVQLFGTPVTAAEAAPTVASATTDESAPAAPTVTLGVEEAVVAEVDQPEPATVPTTTSTPTSSVSGEEAVVVTESVRRDESELTPVDSQETVAQREVVVTKTHTFEESFVSTSTVPQGGAGVSESASGSTPSSIAVLATQPSQVLQIIYTLLSLFVLIVLLVSIVIEIRRQEPMQVVYAYSLLLLMGGMWWLHHALTNTIIIV